MLFLHDVKQNIITFILRHVKVAHSFVFTVFFVSANMAINKSTKIDGIVNQNKENKRP